MTIHHTLSELSLNRLKNEVRQEADATLKNLASSTLIMVEIKGKKFQMVPNPFCGHTIKDICTALDHQVPPSFISGRRR